MRLGGRLERSNAGSLCLPKCSGVRCGHGDGTRRVAYASLVIGYKFPHARVRDWARILPGAPMPRHTKGTGSPPLWRAGVDSSPTGLGADKAPCVGSIPLARTSDAPLEIRLDAWR